jgi:hypothetical protein
MTQQADPGLIQTLTGKNHKRRFLSIPADNLNGGVQVRARH